MLSVITASAADRPAFACLAHLLLILSLGAGGARASSLREHRLRGSEAGADGEAPARPAPNADMLKALQYIESLHQRTSAQQQRPPPFPAARADDAEKLRAVLRLASEPAASEDEDGGEGREDKSEELLQAVLSTLQQTEKAPEGAEDPRTAFPGARQKQRGIRPHQKLPLMFEDEEDGDEGEDEEAPEQESPFKRTNENVEEKYTPQNLATLQSVFDELDKLTAAKAVHKRHGEEDEAEDEEDADVFSVRNVAVDSAGGGDTAEWGPLAEQQQQEEEEEEEEDKQEASRALDYINEDEEEDADEDEEEDGGESFPAKRSEDPDDVANMVDYYLLKVLEKTEEQKRELEEEEMERAERRAARAQRWDAIDPRALYRLIQVSQRYQIPPDDLLHLLQAGGAAARGRSSAGSKPPRAQSRLSHMFSRKKQKAPQAPPHSRRLQGGPKSPEEQRTEEVLNILGLGGGDARAAFRKEWPHKGAPSSRPRARLGPGERRPGAARGDRDDGADEDELAAYLAAQMLAQYPEPPRRKGKAGQKRAEGPGLTDSLEQAVQDYFDHTDSDRGRDDKRRPEDEGRGGGGGARGQGFDSSEVMKLLSFLNPESEESDADAKADDGI